MATQSATLGVKGIRHYHAAAAFQRGALHTGAAIRLEREPSNPHDSNAVAIYLAATGEKLGHISRDAAPGWSRHLAEGLGYRSHVHRAFIDESGRGRARHAALNIEIDVRIDAQRAATGDDWQTAMLPAVPGVYTIRCKTNGRVYVGSSSNVRVRARSHLKELRAGVHHNLLLQRDFVVYTGAAFSFSLYEKLSANLLLRQEARTINSLFAKGEKLYNKTPDGQGSSGACTSVSAAELRSMKPQRGVAHASNLGFSEHSLQSDKSSNPRDEHTKLSRQAPVLVGAAVVGAIALTAALGPLGLVISCGALVLWWAITFGDSTPTRPSTSISPVPNAAQRAPVTSPPAATSTTVPQKRLSSATNGIREVSSRAVHGRAPFVVAEPAAPITPEQRALIANHPRKSNEQASKVASANVTEFVPDASNAESGL